MNRFRELTVWQKAIAFAAAVYAVTAQFPDKERFGLISQLNRAVVSVASNIAEGAGRNSQGEFNSFLGYAVGSAFEVETQLIISEKLHYLDSNKLESLINQLHEIQNMLFKLKKSLGT
ncbi:MAG: four helix bundle protein [Cytophagaceae bacterium]|nr:four helix bundle protein [Cytophagaceae bacterium]